MRTEEEQRNVKLVLDFYDAVINRQQYLKVDEFVDKNYIQHNPEVETGPDGLINFLREVYRQNPHHRARIVRSFAEDNYVILHVQISLGEGEPPKLAVMDIFRIKNGKLMEHWDVAQPVPEASKNNFGMF